MTFNTKHTHKINSGIFVVIWHWLKWSLSVWRSLSKHATTFYGGLHLLSQGQLTDLSLENLFTKIRAIHQTKEPIRNRKMINRRNTTEASDDKEIKLI